jgi:hypothetical protein
MWWKQHVSEFPHLVRMTRQHLSIRTRWGNSLEFLPLLHLLRDSSAVWGS